MRLIFFLSLAACSAMTGFPLPALARPDPPLPKLPAPAVCVLTDVSSSGFGSTGGSSEVDSRQVGSMTVNCKGTYKVGLNAGSWFAGTRRLSDGAGNFVSYRLWQDSAATVEWGDAGLFSGSYPASPLTGAGNSLYPVYGTLSLLETVPPGDYTDVVRLILTYPPYGPDDQQRVDLHISLHVVGTCNVDTSGISGFGTWPLTGADPTGVALGAIGVICPEGVRYAVGMDSGLYYDGRLRRMSDGTGFVPYVLRAGSGNGVEWGDSGLSAIEPAYVETYPAAAVYNVGNGGYQFFYVWGDAQLSSASAGTYRDTVNLTVAW